MTKWRIPITAITVFGASSLLAVSVGIVLLLGFGQAAKSTRQLWAEQSEALIDAIEQSLVNRLEPIREQARWIARDINDISNPRQLDDYMFGALAATPQVAGFAIVSDRGFSRRWQRDRHTAIDEDWSQRPWIIDYLDLVRQENRPAWREPIFTDTIDSSTLLHDIPLLDPKGNFIGLLAQVVTVEDLSNYLAQHYRGIGVTPFVLYDHEFVLAHPRIGDGSESRPLRRLEELDDPVLKRIWTPDEPVAFIQKALARTRASGVYQGGDYHLLMYRDVDHFGPAPWTIGAYVNTSLLDEKPGERVMRALAAGLAVLVLAVAASVYVGRKVSAPIKALVGAAESVDRGDLDHVPALGGSRIRELDEAGSAFNRMVTGLRERKLIRDTLGRFVPEEIAGSLLAGGGQLEVQQAEATILFCDIESFTELTETLGPIRIVEVLNVFFSAMVDILEDHGGVATQFQGDAILATFNVPIADPAHARNAILAAREMLECADRQRFAGAKIGLRIGINTGPVVAGAVGAKGRLSYTVHGDAVNRAARLEALNKDYGTRLLIAERTAALADGVELRCVGETRVRGQTESLKLLTLAQNAGGD